MSARHAAAAPKFVGRYVEFECNLCASLLTSLEMPAHEARVCPQCKADALKLTERGPRPALASTAVARRMTELRHYVGIEDEDAFQDMTVREIEAALARPAWCGKHGGHRCGACIICCALGKGGKGK